MQKYLVIIFCILGFQLYSESISRFNIQEPLKVNRPKDKKLNAIANWTISENDDFDGFSYVSRIEISDENIYILDNEEWIHVFDFDGNYIDTFGESGKGPGEIMSLKDFAFYSNSLFLLDKGKYTLSKFSKDYDLIWEKKLPVSYSQVLSPEQITVNKEGIFISGFSVNKDLNNVSVLFKFSHDFELVEKLLPYVNTNVNDPYGMMCKTANRIASNDDMIYVSMANGSDFLYPISLKNNKIKYILEKIIPHSGEYKLEQHSQGGVELMTYFNTLSLNCSENYIFVGENGGAFSKEKGKIKVPNGYANNAALYTSNGEYLGSIFLPLDYTYTSFNTGIYETQNEIHLFIYSQENMTLHKFIAKKSDLGKEL